MAPATTTSASSAFSDDASAVDVMQPLFGVSICFIVLNTLFMVLRFYAVMYLRPKKLALAWDDWFLIPAYAFTIGVAAIALTMRHWETLGNPPGHELFGAEDLWRLEPVLQCIFALLQLLVPAYAFTRFSILALYLRVFTGKIVRTISYCMIAFITAQMIAFMIASALQCNPVRHYWDKTIDGTCVDINAFNRSFTPVNVAADAIILFFPFPTIWRLNVSRSRKVGITFVLGLGTAALVASIVRLAVLETNTTTEISPALSNDIITWLVIEPSLYFITACLPTMHPLFRLCVPSSLRRYTEKRLANHRQSEHPKLGDGHRLSFTRLMENGDTLGKIPSIPGTVAEPTNTARADAGFLPLSELGHYLSEHEQDVPLQDLKQVQGGQQIMMTTEVTVTQEDRVGDVLGF